MDTGLLRHYEVARMPNNPRFLPTPPRVVELLAFPSVQLLDVAGPLQVFATATEVVAPARGGPAYAPVVVGRDGASVAASAGLGLALSPLSPFDAPLDTLVVAGGPGVHAALEDPDLRDWVRARAERARRTVSVCTGAFLLGACGLLDGRRATTHWALLPDFARRFPHVRVESDPIFVRDGPVWTSAGVTAGIDLALALVEEDLGPTVALAVARYLVVFLKRPGGQAQFSATLALQSADDRYGALHAWIVEHLDADLSIAALARRAGMSERSFCRRYREDTGSTPARAVEQLRLEGARGLLTTTSLPIKRIAARSGFGTEETMRRSFLRVLAVTPQDYRLRFRVG